MEGRAQILSRIKDFCSHHGIDIDNELLSYDRKKNGIISAVSFHRCIASIGINLSNRNIQSVVMEYQKGDGIDVRRLLDELHGVKGYNETLLEQPTPCQDELIELSRDMIRRRQTLRELLEPYDRTNTGKVTINNFYRALGSSPVTNTIVNSYAQGEYINYLRLEKDVKGLNRESLVEKIEIPEPTPAFVKIATYIKSRSIDYRITFSNADRLSTGKLQSKQFYAILASFGASMSPGEIQEVANSFQNGAFCNYSLFVSALDSFVPPMPDAAVNQPEVPDHVRQAHDPEKILEYVKYTVVDRRIDVQGHFDCLKLEHAGEEIANGRFNRIIQGMGLSLSIPDIDALGSLFHGRNGIRYNDFITAVTPQIQRQVTTTDDIIPRLKQHLANTGRRLALSAHRFDRENSGCISVQQLFSSIQFTDLVPGPTQQEINALRDAFPGQQRGTVDWRSICQVCDPPQELHEEEEEPKQQEQVYNPPPKNIEDVMLKIVRSARANDMSIYDNLREMDRLRKGEIMQTLFTNFILSIPQVNLNQVDLRWIISYYRVSGSGNINYMAFCSDADFVEKKVQQEQIQKECIIDLQEKELELPATVHAFLKRYKAFIEMNRIQPGEPFEPYDNGHNGMIPIFKVQACFNNINFQVMRQEVEQIVSYFRDVKKQELFNYLNFAKSVNKEDISSNESRSTLASAPISNEVIRNAIMTCCQIREKLMARHRTIDGAFAGVTSQYLPNRDFQQRLLSVEIILSASQIQALLRKYRVNLSDEIDWRSFCNDVNTAKTIGE